MLRPLLVASIALAGCGRWHFDEHGGTSDDASGASDASADAAFVGMQKTYGKPSAPGAGDLFGGGLAISADGMTVAVAAFHEDSAATGIDGNEGDNSAIDSGAVYVFRRSGNIWSREAYVKAPNTNAGDQFGRSLALSADGGTLAIGANREDSAATGINGGQADNSALDSGAVYVFVRTGTTWSAEAYVKASNTGAGDSFGTSVALSADGNTLAVGAYFEDSAASGVGGSEADNSRSNSGAAYVFRRAGTTWNQQAYVKASNTDADDLFGGSIALSGDGNTLAIGAPLEDSAATGIDGAQADNSMNEAGAAYVFTRVGTAWSQQAYVKPSNTHFFDVNGSFFQFTWGVALSNSGDTLAVGARFEPSAATGIDGNQTDNTAGGAGAVYLFGRTGTTWTQQAYIKASNTQANDTFGEVVDLSEDGRTLAVTAPFEDSAAVALDGDQASNSAPGSGAVYLYVRPGDVWIQHAYVKATNTGAGDELSSAALSGDGSTLVIGAGREDSAATGIGGNQADNSVMDSGAIYFYY